MRHRIHSRVREPHRQDLRSSGSSAQETNSIAILTIELHRLQNRILTSQQAAPFVFNVGDEAVVTCFAKAPT